MNKIIITYFLGFLIAAWPLRVPRKDQVLYVSPRSSCFPNARFCPVAR